MKLSELQQEFAECVGKLITYATSEGIGLTLGDAYRDPRLHGEFGTKESYAAKHSVHKVRLAIDFNVFVKGEYITDGKHQSYMKLGTYWKGLHTLARWGGDFRDYGHFSFEYQGYK